MIKRIFDRRHAPELIAFGRKFHAASKLSVLPFDPKRCEKTLLSALISTEHAVWAAYHDGAVSGVMIGALCSYPFFNATYATDILFLAELHGEELFREFVKWAIKARVDALQLGVSSGMPQADAFYEAVGLQRVGGMYFGKLKEASICRT